MTPASSIVRTPDLAPGRSIPGQIDGAVQALIASLPAPQALSTSQRRGIIARYTAVLEGNFIYWMTGAYLAVKSDLARGIILDNLREEVRDCHPGMLRRFAVSASAVPTDVDSLAVSLNLMKVRGFIGRLSGVQIVMMMAFFEGFIQRFMSYLADLAKRQGSTEMEYTDVHGVCDVAHSQELFRALDQEMAADPSASGTELLEGVELLSALIATIIQPVKVMGAAAGIAHGLDTH